MITLERPAYFSSERYAEYYGLSTDDKDTVQANNADKFYEIDTGKIYRYNESSHEWIEQPDSTTAIDTGIPPITSETAGHFLSNDGNVTHWQDIASQNFVVALTENNGTYIADKTYVQIKAAYDGLENIVARVANSGLPLMNAEFADNGDVSFIFGYTQARLDGQIVSTRAIAYLHTSTGDTWEDADETADLSEYLLLAGGTMSGDIVLANEPTNDKNPATKKYVDDNVAKCLKLTTGANGTLKAYVQNGTKQDVCSISANGDSNAIVRYGVEGRITVKTAPTADTHVANKQYVDEQVKTVLPLTGGTLTGSLEIDGTLVVNGTASVSAMPTNDSGVANKQYVDNQVTTKVNNATANMVVKKSVSLASGKTTNIPLSSGVYLFTTCDDDHRGWTCVSVYSSGEDIDDIVTLVGWKCNKMPTNTRGVTLTNSASSAMTIYITSIGAGTY